MNMKFTGLLAKLSSFHPNFDGTVQMSCNSITTVPTDYPSKIFIYMRFCSFLRDCTHSSEYYIKLSPLLILLMISLCSRMVLFVLSGCNIMLRYAYYINTN